MSQPAKEPRRERPRPLRLVDTDLTPEWDVTLSVRGVDVPALSPQVGEAQGDDGLALGAFRMLLPGAWRRKLRRDCLQLVPREFRALVAQLTPGEMQMLVDRYTAAQMAWMADAAGRAHEMAAQHFEARRARTERSAPGNEPLRSSALKDDPSAPSSGMMPVIPGKRLPFWASGGPVFGAASRATQGKQI